MKKANTGAAADVDAPTPVTFLVPGEADIAAPRSRGQPDLPHAFDDASRAGIPGTVTQRVRVAQLRSGSTSVIRMTAQPGSDVVVISVDRGPDLVLHPYHARDLFRAQATSAAVSRGASGGEDVVSVSAELAWPEVSAARAATRGGFLQPIKQALITAIEIVSGGRFSGAARISAAELSRLIEKDIREGVYAVGTEADALDTISSRQPVPAGTVGAGGGIALMLVHGTFVNTASTFQKLWTQEDDTLRRLAQEHEGIYALDHRTLSATPFENALSIVKACAPGARLRLLTHSRGGLVAEALARACEGELIPDELGMFEDRVEADGTKLSFAHYARQLQELCNAAQSKRIQVERILRVGCPARGTLLAGGRLDAYLSVLKWGLQASGALISAGLLDFLLAVAARRTRPDELPGLEAQIPDRPLVRWLNASPRELSGQLRVVAGDIEGDSLWTWLKTLLADAYFWTDNDLVVQTRSMYGGAPRKRTGLEPGASFLLDRGGKVSHFTYFSNQTTVNAIVSGLLEPRPPGFLPIGPLSWQGDDASGIRAARRTRNPDRSTAGELPAVFVLPGILGSNLERDGRRVWVPDALFNWLKLIEWDPTHPDAVQAAEPLGAYDQLIDMLGNTHEVVPFGFDWRRPIEDEATRLAGAVRNALDLRGEGGPPVRIIAHSMGALVVRTMALIDPGTWARMLKHPQARVLMLGPPNGGSWAPMQVLSGDDSFGNMLTSFGSLFDDARGRRTMAEMPGFLQLQAGLLDPDLRLGEADSWTKLANEDRHRVERYNSWFQDGPSAVLYRWGAPPQHVLDKAVALRKRLDNQARSLGADAARLMIVLGSARFTPDGYTMDVDGLSYRNAAERGDGRVTISSARLPGVPTWQAGTEHGRLASQTGLFSAYVELLSKGDTSQLPRAPETDARSGATRGEDKGSVERDERSPAEGVLLRGRASRTPRPPSGPDDVLLLREPPAPSSQAPLSIEVINGDFRFVQHPLLLGHYRSLRLTGSEDVADKLLGGLMSQALAARLYPDEPGTHQAFANRQRDAANPWVPPRPAMVLVAGMGDEGQLKAQELAFTVRQSIIAYAQRMAEEPEQCRESFELAAVLLGSGAAGMSAGRSAQMLAMGALEANRLLQANGWPRLSRLRIVERYLDRASEAWHALRQLDEARHRNFTLGDSVQFGKGQLRYRVESGYRGSEHDMISAVSGPPERGQPTIAFTVDSQRARTELRAQKTQGRLLAQLIGRGSNDREQDRRIGRTLYNLLIPYELGPVLGGNTATVLEVDPITAAIPWELLDTSEGHATTSTEPWAIRTKLLRKLRTASFRRNVSNAGRQDDVLVIGEPLAPRPPYGRLPAAASEATAVARMMRDYLGTERVYELVKPQPDAHAVINALYERTYRVLHIAGHGELGTEGGVVLSDGVYLGASEVDAMRLVPELVFLNCCHLAARDPGILQTVRTFNRSEFAANVAEALIRVGVRCVIAAGWAVEDKPAERFAEEFYRALIEVDLPFIDAVQAARRAAWNANPAGNTWAAYQCYGDPDWRWNPDETRTEQRSSGSVNEVLASPVGLAILLETLASEAAFSDAGKQEAKQRLPALEKAYGERWGQMGAVAEAFALGFSRAGLTDQALTWYQRAASAADASASFRAAEQRDNLQARQGEKLENKKAGAQAITASIERMSTLHGLYPTGERANILASAYKLRALNLAASDAPAAQQSEALELMQQYYDEAAQMKRDNKEVDEYYPLMNSLAGELRRAVLQPRGEWTKPLLHDDARFNRAQESLNRAVDSSPDFWAYVGQVELQMLHAVNERRLPTSATALVRAFSQVHERVPSVPSWDSVYKNARFVLEPFERSAPDDEQSAATTLLHALRDLAGMQDAH